MSEFIKGVKGAVSTPPPDLPLLIEDCIKSTKVAKRTLNLNLLSYQQQARQQRRDHGLYIKCRPATIKFLKYLAYSFYGVSLNELLNILLETACIKLGEDGAYVKTKRGYENEYQNFMAQFTGDQTGWGYEDDEF